MHPLAVSADRSTGNKGIGIALAATIRCCIESISSTSLREGKTDSQKGQENKDCFHFFSDIALWQRKICAKEENYIRNKTMN